MHALPPELSLPFLPSTISLASASYSLHIYLPLIFAHEQVHSQITMLTFSVSALVYLTCFAFTESFAGSNSSCSSVICALSILPEPQVSTRFYSQKTIKKRK